MDSTPNSGDFNARGVIETLRTTRRTTIGTFGRMVTASGARKGSGFLFSCHALIQQPLQQPRENVLSSPFHPERNLFYCPVVCFSNRVLLQSLRLKERESIDFISFTFNSSVDYCPKDLFSNERNSKAISESGDRD